MKPYPCLYDADLSKSTLVISKYYNEHYKYYRMNEHSHSAFEIMYAKTGKCRIVCINPETLIREEFTLNEGHYVYIYSNIVHNLLVDRDSPCRILNIEIETEACKKNEAFSLESLSISASLTKFISSAPIYSIVKDDGSMYGILSNLHEILNDTRTSKMSESDISAELVLSAAVLLLKISVQTQRKNISDNFSGIYVRRAKRYIQEHYDNNTDITVAKIAAYVKISEAYLQRLFRTETGDTIFDYVNFLRLKKAKHLLEKTDLSLVDISVNVGLGSRQRLNQLFLSLEGISPGKYRTRYRNMEFEQQ